MNAGAGAGTAAAAGAATTPAPAADRPGAVLLLPWLLLALAALSFGYLATVEFVGRRDMPLQIDELFFATCAARGVAVGDVPVSGCHDTKGPLIYVVYQALQIATGQPYPLAAFKAAAFALAAALAAACGALAYRFGRRPAALLAAAFVLQLFVTDPWFMALKPELVGSALLMAAVLLLTGGPPLPGRLRLFAAGVLLGLAFAAKQTFLFAAVAVCCWVAWAGLRDGARAAAWRRLLGDLIAVVGGLLLPSAAFFTLFAAQGRDVDYLASLFVYPTLYRIANPQPLAKVLLLRVAMLATHLQPFAPLVLLCTVALVAVDRRGAAVARRRDARFALLVFCLGGTLAIVLVSPVVLRFHVMPACTVAATIAAAVTGRWLAEPPAGVDHRRPLAAALLVAALMVTLVAWSGPAANPLRDRDRLVSASLPAGGGRFGYVVGIWPKLYVDNGLIPASDILYPTALPGAPAGWAYAPPDAASIGGRLQQRNVGRLLADFERTPPGVIVTVDGEAGAAGSPNSTDIDVLRGYIARHCRPERRIDVPMHIAASVFACDARR